MPRSPRIELDADGPDVIDGRHVRAVTFQDVRLEYTRGVVRRSGIVPTGSRALVVGNGHGPLARSLTSVGFDVTAADPSAEALALALTEGLDARADVRPVVAEAHELPFDTGSFDFVYVADTFEVTAHFEQAVGQVARMLRPDGVLVYDTVARTPLARLIYLGAFQAIPGTRIVPPGRYAADRLRPPRAMSEALARHGLGSEDACGFKPKSVRALASATRLRRKGRLTDEQTASRVPFVLEPDRKPLVTYLGWARKRP